MSINDLLPYITIFGFIGTIITTVWAISRRYSAIEQKFLAIDNSLKIIVNSLKANFHFQETILQILSKAKLLTNYDNFRN